MTLKTMESSVSRANRAQIIHQFEDVGMGVDEITVASPSTELQPPTPTVYSSKSETRTGSNLCRGARGRIPQSVDLSFVNTSGLELDRAVSFEATSHISSNTRSQEIRSCT